MKPVKKKTKWFSDEHLSRAQIHFLKRLHERFGCGAGRGLHAEIVNAINANDETRVRLVRDVPMVVPGPRWQHPRLEYLVNICDRYAVIIFCPTTQIIYSCWWTTNSFEAFQVKAKVKAEGGLLPFTTGISKRPKHVMASASHPAPRFHPSDR